MKQANVSELDPRTLQEIKKLHFQTRRLAQEGVAGSYRSAFRGRGIEFEEVREYIPGDDVRTIDWKVTARSRKTFVKSYREERELTVLLAVDVSGSTFTGTRNQLRETLIARVGAVLTLIALNNNDKVGLVTFSDRIETYHPPRKARSSVWRILHEVLTPGSYQTGTDIAVMLSFLSRIMKRKAVLFIVSDFIGAPFEKELATVAKRHDLTAIRVCDPADFSLPSCGLVQLRDPENGNRQIIDSSNAQTRRAYEERAAALHEQQTSMFRRHSAALLDLWTNRPFMPEIRRFFEKKRVSGR